ncbi:MAG TPA: prepilin-type N-terminal cleavage/methylation domain-containing protein [Terriglobales bacterium]|nr:prepilin-type N-terminal cleavage/methylation domain-containing protein [Terriglobales bacterium]
MRRLFTKTRKAEQGFSILEMLLATVILLVGLVAIAQLVPATILMNYRNRTDSSALVFAQRQLDQMLDQQLIATSFTDVLGNVCQLGNPSPANAVQGSGVLYVNNQTLINFSASPVSGYSFTYQDPTDPSGTTYDVRWAVIVTGNGSTPSSKRYILGVRQLGGNGYFLPITLDTLVTR